MADNEGAHASGSSIEPGRDEDKKSRRKKYLAERDATKIYLYDQFNRWRQLKGQVNVKTDKEVAALLLDNYFSSRQTVSSRYILILMFAVQIVVNCDWNE